MGQLEEEEDADGHLLEGHQEGAEERATAYVSTDSVEMTLVRETHGRAPRTAMAEEHGPVAARAWRKEPQMAFPTPTSDSPGPHPNDWQRPKGPGRTRGLGVAKRPIHNEAIPVAAESTHEGVAAATVVVGEASPWPPVSPEQALRTKGAATGVESGLVAAGAKAREPRGEPPAEPMHKSRDP